MEKHGVHFPQSVNVAGCPVEAHMPQTVPDARERKRERRETMQTRNIIQPNFLCVDMSELIMPMIVVYKSPRDFPGKYVARLFRLDKPTNVVVVKTPYKKFGQSSPGT